MRNTLVRALRSRPIVQSRCVSESLREKLKTGPTLDDFISGAASSEPGQQVVRRERGVKAPWNPDERLPEWLKVPVPAGKNFTRIKNSVKSHGLATVCEEAKCPNIGECWGGKEGTATATIMVLGDTCTRGCRFCAVKTSNAPPPPDPNEPTHVASTIGKWGVDYVVMTTVDRDDLPDGGSSHFAECVRQIKDKANHITLECLTGDYAGKREDITRVVLSGMDVFAHNVETVDRLQPVVRDRRASYRQSLMVLQLAKELRPDLPTKSSIMLGCGETDEEVRQTFKDLRAVGVDIVTLGQYLRPTKRHMKVSRYVTPAEFDEWRVVGEQMGFSYVASGPLVRSSYRAGEFFIKSMLRKNTKPAQAVAQ